MRRDRSRSPKTASRTTIADLDCAFVKNALIFLNLNALYFPKSAGHVSGPLAPFCPPPGPNRTDYCMNI